MTRPRRVLIVEDNPLNRELCVEILAGEGYTAVAAATVAEARRRLAESRPDVVLLDWHLPEASGAALLTELGGQRSSPPVVVVTADARPEVRADAFSLGAAGLLTKPFVADELLAAVASGLQPRPGEDAS
jgi:two-component system phosphate regulon response regulator PhoB